VVIELDRADVTEALGALSDTQREAVSLAFYGGLTYREVATRLAIPEGTAKTRIRDGLTKLRDLMGAAS
jgi:RNA polymerase sigma-70 factor (ECF subfamily)